MKKTFWKKAVGVLYDTKMNVGKKSPRAVVGACIHAILARESDTAVVFRRGPSNKTAILKWDLLTDRFELGQWFYGSFYPYRCDISPDGRHLVYFAAEYGRGSSMEEYIESRIKAELGEISWFHGGQYYQRMERIVNDSATRRESAVAGRPPYRVAACAECWSRRRATRPSHTLERRSIRSRRTHARRGRRRPRRSAALPS